MIKFILLLLVYTSWCFAGLGQCPNGLALEMGGTTLNEGDPVCNLETLNITIDHTTSAQTNPFSLYWDTNGTHSNKVDVVSSGTKTLIEGTITPTASTSSTVASPWSVDPGAGVTTFFIYVIREITGCNGGSEFGKFELNHAEITGQPVDEYVCPGDSGEFEIFLSFPSSNNKTHVLWQVDSTGTFLGLSNSNPYYSPFDETLSINPISSFMLLYNYRARIRYGVNNSNFYCEQISDTVSINLTATPNPNITVNNTSFDFCSSSESGTITIQNAEVGITYVLRDPSNQAVDCGIGDGSNLDLNFFGGSGSGTYTIEAGTGSCGMNPSLDCVTTLNTSVSVNIRNVSAANIGSDETICEGEAISTLDGSSSNEDGGTADYLWESSTTSANGPFGPAQGTNDGSNYDAASISQTTWYRLVFSSDFGGGAICYDTSNVVEKTLNEIQAGTIEDNQTICEGDTPTNLDSTPGGDGSGSGTIRYRYVRSTNGTTWNPAGGTYGTSTQFTFPQVPTETTFYRRVTRSALNGVYCYDSSNVVTITVSESPSININPAGPFCSDDGALNLSVSITPSGGSGTWSGTGITNAVIGTFNPSMADIGNNNIQYMHTLPTGCADSDLESIIVNQTPELRDTTTSACAGDPINYTPLSNDVSGLSGPAFEYYNTLNDAQTGISPISSSEIFSSQGSYQRYYRRVSNGCIDIGQIDINILPPPEATNIILSVDPQRMCTGDTTNLQICGLEPNTAYVINYDTDGSAPRTESIISNALGCYSLPTNGFNTPGTKTYEIQTIEFSSGCGISPNPIPANMQIEVVVNGRPDAGDIIDDLESPSCYNGSPAYELSGLDNSTDYTIQYAVNGGATQSFSGTSDGSGTLFPSIGNFTEDIMVELLDIRFNDGDTECAADPAPDNSTNGTVRPDLSAITLVGDTICEDPGASVTVTFQNVPMIGQKIDFTLIGDSIDQTHELPINANPEVEYTFPFGVNVNAAQSFPFNIASISFRNAPECTDDSTRNGSTILVSERPNANFDDSDIPCISHERTIGNLTEPAAARSIYTYQWVYNGNVLGTDENLTYTFQGRPASLPLKLIAGSGDCVDSVTKDIFFDNGGPEFPQVLVLFREDANENRLPGAILLVDNPDTARLSYQWYNAGSMVADKGDRHFLFVPSYDPLNPPNTYNVEASFKNPGSGESDCGTRSELIRLGNGTVQKLSPSLLAYPNPNDGHFQIHVTGSDEGLGILQMQNLQGKVVYRQVIKKETSFIKQKLATELAPGLYILSWYMPGNVPISTKLSIR